MPDYWRDLVNPANRKFETFAQADSALEPLNAKPVHAAGQGFRSATTGHFNYQTPLSGIVSA